MFPESALKFEMLSNYRLSCWQRTLLNILETTEVR